METSKTVFGQLLEFLERLERAKIWYRLLHVRDSIMVAVDLPGYRWEVEFFENGAIEFEEFASTGVKRISTQELEQMLMELEAGDSGSSMAK
jgi:hypothetical protein